jgi:hypothetical protein
MSRRPAAIAAAIVLALGAVLFARFVLADRDVVASTPSPRPVFTVHYQPLKPGEQLCIQDVTIPADARRVRMQVRTYGKPGPQLAIELAARGYAERLTVAGGYADLTTLDAPMTPPPTDVLGRVCLSQRSPDIVALAGTTEERTQSRPHSALDDTAVAGDSYLAFYEGRRASALRETPAIIDRMQAFKPGIAGPWLLWPLLALTLVGVPAGVVWAALRAARA